MSTVVVFKYGDRQESPDPDDGAFGTDGAGDQPVSSLPVALLDAFNSWVSLSGMLPVAHPAISH